MQKVAQKEMTTDSVCGGQFLSAKVTQRGPSGPFADRSAVHSDRSATSVTCGRLQPDCRVTSLYGRPLSRSNQSGTAAYSADMSRLHCIVLFALCACGSEPLERLFLIERIPRGEICASGGSQIRSGLDHNQNGELDPDEIDLEELRCSTHR